MKRIFILIMIILLSHIGYGQYLIRDDFSVNGGATTVVRANFDWANMGTGNKIKILTDSTATNYNTTVGGVDGIYWDSSFTTANRPIVIGCTIEREEASTTRRYGYLNFLNTTNTTTGAEGYRIRFRGSETGIDDDLTLYSITGGNNSVLSSLSVIIDSANGSTAYYVDTLLFIMYADGRKTAQLRHSYTTRIDSVTTTNTVHDTIANWYASLQLEIGNQTTVVDNFIISSYGQYIEPPPPPLSAGDTIPPVVVDYAINPTYWNTTTTGNITVRVTDESVAGLDSIYIRWNGYDSLKVKCGGTNDTTISKSISSKTAGSYTYNVRAVDTAGNITTTVNKSISVGTEHQFGNLIFSIAIQGIDGSAYCTCTNPNSYHVGFNRFPLSDIDVVIWWDGRSNYLSTTAPYAMLKAVEPPVASATDPAVYNDYVYETAALYTGGHGLPVSRMRYRDSVMTAVQGHGGKMLLDVGRAATATFKYIFSDSLRAQMCIDTLFAYLDARGYDGVSYDWEGLTSADAMDFLRMVRMTRTKANTYTPAKLINIWVMAYGTNLYGPVATLNTLVDFISPMAYGMGQYTGLATGNIIGHNTALYPPTCYTDIGYNSSIDRSTMAWLNAGADTNKLCGVFSGEMKLTIQAGTVEVCDPRQSQPRYANYQNYIDNIYNLGIPERWDAIAEVPYQTYSNASGWNFFSADNPNSFMDKGNYYKSKKLKNLNIWDPARAVICDTVASGRRQQELFDVLVAIKGSSIDTIATLPQTILVSPANGITNVSMDTVVFRWRPSSGSTAYQILCGLDASVSIPNAVVNITKADTYAVISPLAFINGNTYYWKVRPVINSTTYGLFSDIRNFTVQSISLASDTPSVPILVSPSNNSTGVSVTPTFSWTGDSLADYYILQAKLSLTGGDSVTANIAIQSNITSTSYTPASGTLLNSTAYYWRVSAVNQVGASAWSPYRRFVTVASTSTPDSAGSSVKYVYFGTDKVRRNSVPTVLPILTISDINQAPTPPNGIGYIAVVYTSVDVKMYLVLTTQKILIYPQP